MKIIRIDDDLRQGTGHVISPRWASDSVNRNRLNRALGDNNPLQRATELENTEYSSQSLSLYAPPLTDGKVNIEGITTPELATSFGHGQRECLQHGHTSRRAHHTLSSNYSAIQGVIMLCGRLADLINAFVKRKQGVISAK